MQNLTTIVLIAGVILIALFAIGLILAKLYHRASKEISFVRTGFGGQKVIMNGGALVLPVLHETIKVNMNTLRLEVRRANEQALITRDRVRVDVQAEFYVRVKPTIEAIADAAQTLGQRTLNPMALKELIEGKFVDALRSVAAEMAMEELHEQRVSFVLKVQTTVSEDLLKNGLELEAVSLTALDQTSQEYLNAQNAFDAQGLTRLTEQIEARRKQRNDIERDTEVLVKAKNLEAEQRKLEIAREEEYAKLDQQREIAVRRASQAAEIAREEAEKERESRQAQIEATQRIDLAVIGSERAVDEERIERERMVKEKDIARTRSVETAEIEKTKSIQLSEQDRGIAIAERSKDLSESEADANRARGLAVQAEEEVVTVREKEIAERKKKIELVEASQEAERRAIGVTVYASAEKKASEDRALAIKIIAEADAEKVKIEADGEAQAEIAKAEAASRRYEVEAEGKRALNEADNVLSAEIIALHIKKALIERMPEIIRESVRPMERIDGIKIIQVAGLAAGGGGNGNGTAAGGDSGSNLADQVVNSALRYRGQAPLVDSLLKEIGITSKDINGLTAALKDEPEKAPAN
ncbi:MAG: flotillin domain-containing protein [Opitutales bacterium]